MIGKLKDICYSLKHFLYLTMRIVKSLYLNKKIQNLSKETKNGRDMNYIRVDYPNYLK